MYIRPKKSEADPKATNAEYAGHLHYVFRAVVIGIIVRLANGW